MRMHRLLVCLGLLGFITFPVHSQLLRIYYPDIEQGSSTLVVSPAGKALLIDGGSGLKSTEDAIEDFINDLMDSGVVSSVDFVIATHYDEDHIGRLENVLQLVPLSPSSVVYDRGEVGGVPNTFAYSDYAFSASFHNRTTITPNTTLDLGGGVTVRCFAVNAELPDGSTVDLTGTNQQENARSVAVVVQFGDVDVWIGGDLTGNPLRGVAEVEGAVAPFTGDVDVYTFNHHGSETSSEAQFLSTLRAEVGIAQVSAANSFGHPVSTVVQRFLATDDSSGATPVFYQQNPGDPDDTRSDDSLAQGIADCDDTVGAFGLPGTLTLLSDGASYRLHACGIAATAFAADSGPGTVGDYPPAVRRVLRTPLVPLATEGVTVEAHVEDLEDLEGGGAVSVELRYDLDGVAQAPIPMTLATGITYTATLPAQPDGAQVRFRVAAQDGVNPDELSLAQGYYSGTTPISTLRDNDASGVLIPKRFGARVQGTVTVEPGVFHSFVTQSYLEDATGGVQIFDSSLLPGVARGDLLEIVGELEQFAGQTEISMARDFGNIGFKEVGTAPPPTPQVLTVAQVGEAVEGLLVRIHNVRIVSGTFPGSGNANLTVSDDGGTSTLTLRIDGDTDIPGSNTPTQAFDIVGIASQFDTFVPLTSGYQIVPRGTSDLFSEEVNHPPVLIGEIHADPAEGLAGDANGDGTRSAGDDEFIEIVNTDLTAVDIGGWTLSDSLNVRHTFPAGTVLPPREAAVVFGGGVPSGDFGNAQANGLVFTASTGSLSLNNGGDTVTLKDDLGAVVQSVSYASEGGQNQSLVRDPDFSNAPFVLHSQAGGASGSLYSPGTRIGGQPFTIARGALILTEVLYDAGGSDNGLEWVELFNTTGQAIDLAEVCIGNGGGDYTSSLVSLQGTVASQAPFVVGGPTSGAANGNPVFDLAVDFSPDFQNSDSTTADGVALFNVRCSQVTAATVPIDSVVYGPANTNNLIDETGAPGPPEVGDVSSGQSIERIDLAGNWQIQPLPNPNVAFPPPPPGGLVLSEVFYNASGSDDGLEWVELFNSGAQTLDLASFSLGNGGTSYTSSVVQLAGTLAPGQLFVVGGPTSQSSNGNPAYDQVINFNPDFQNGGSTADGVALFNVPAAAVTASTVPIDAVVYGSNNSNGLVDETGTAHPPDVGNAPEGSTLERLDLAGTWQIQSSPSPGTSSLSGNTAPSVSITAPASGSSFAQGASIQFSATAGDAEDGDLSGSLTWTSNLDGALGSGGSLSVTLSVGSHTVTAAVTDGGGASGSDAVDVTVVAGSSGGLILSEVLYDVQGGDDGLEWIELYNSGSTSVNLAGFSLGAGGSDYTTTRVQLSGTVAPGQTFVVGGPQSQSKNANPSYDLVVNLSPDLQNSGSVADGVALFDLPASQITAATVPIDAVVYGGSNSNNLIDETGSANPPEVGDAPQGSSIERTDLAGSWRIQSSPTPNASPL